MQEAAPKDSPKIVSDSTADFSISSTSMPRMRVARPTFDLNRAITFWTQVVGFDLLSRFEDHEGYDGAIMGVPAASWELEVTKHSSGQPVPSPTEEDLIALYLPRVVATTITTRLQSAGYQPYDHTNPYWKDMGASVFNDPDGYALIIYPTD